VNIDAGRRIVPVIITKYIYDINWTKSFDVCSRKEKYMKYKKKITDKNKVKYSILIAIPHGSHGIIISRLLDPTIKTLTANEKQNKPK